MTKLAILLSTTAIFFNTALATVFPANDMRRNDDINRQTEVTREVFENTIKRVQAVYAPIVAKLGGQLSIIGEWENRNVNGEADRQGDKWLVSMYGALARVPGMKPEHFLFQVCHELAHHVAGFPFFDGVVWVASESEADYYASRICLKKVLADEKQENARVAAQASTTIKKRCAENWSTTDEQNLCARVSTIGEAYAKFYAKIRGWYPPSVDTPEDFEVYKTFFSHAKAQVKLDIYFAGALCNAPWDDSKIPGYRSEESGEHNSLEAEQEAAAVSCHPGSGYVDGLRPKSYFLPSFDFKPIQIRNFQTSVLPLPGRTFKVNPNFTNASDSTTIDVKASIESRTEGVRVVSGQANVSNIAPGGLEAVNKPFELQVDANVQCGSPIELKITASSASSGTANFKKIFYAGSFEESLVGRSTTVVPIPVWGEVSSPIQVTTTAPVRRVHVKANIFHTYARDMKIFIVAPDGQMRFLSSPAPTEDYNIKIDKEVDLPVANPAGEWNLYIVDDMDSSDGRLLNWDLNFKRANCN